MNDPDPWNLTPAQARAMSAVIETGSNKGAARRLNLSTKTVESHTAAAKFKIGKAGQIAHFLEWDRWLRRPEPVFTALPSLQELTCNCASLNSSSTATPTASSPVQNEHHTFI